MTPTEPGRPTTSRRREKASLASLRRQWRAWAAASLVLLLAAALVLWVLWPVAAPGLVLATALWLAALWLVWLGLVSNRRPAGSVTLPRLGAGTFVSLLRGLVLALLSGFVVLPPPPPRLAWLPAALYTAGVLGDLVDGHLARRARHVTVLGARLDLELDSFGVLVAVTLGVLYAKLPPWYFVLGLVRYAFVVALWWRRQRGLCLEALVPSRRRRFLAGLHMVFLSAALWPVVPAVSTRVAAPLVAAATLVSFTMDWLYVTGRLATRLRDEGRRRPGS